MTCEAFRYINSGPACWLASTRAQRSACIRHYKDCAECHAWLDKAPDVPNMTEQQYEAWLKMQQEDQLDPEFDWIL